MSFTEMKFRVNAPDLTAELTIYDLRILYQCIKTIRSPSFFLAGKGMYLKIRVAELADIRTPISMYLFNDTGFGPNTSCTMGIKKPDGTVFKTFRDVESTDSMFFVEFATNLRELQEALDTRLSEVTFFCTLVPKSSGQNKPESMNPGAVAAGKGASKGTEPLSDDQRLAHTIERLFVSGVNSDVKIKAGDRELPVHKCVLSSRSPVFDAMFKHEMAENLSGVVPITEFDAPSVEAFLHFLYTKDENLVTEKNAVELCKLAEKYQLMDLKKLSLKFVGSHLQIDTILDVFDLANLLGEQELLQTAKCFFQHYTSQILQTPQWDEFIVKHPRMATELFLLKVHCAPWPLLHNPNSTNPAVG